MIPLPNSCTVTAVVGRFRDFLNSAWPAMNEILKHHDWDDDPYFLDDWLDKNWGLIVGRKLIGDSVDLQPLSIGKLEVMKKQYAYFLETSSDPTQIFISLATDMGGITLAPPFDVARVMGVDGEIINLPFERLQLKLAHNSLDVPV